QAAVADHFPSFGHKFVAIALFFFAFTTVMAYYYYAETNVAYIFKGKSTKAVLWILRVAFLFSVFFGTVRTANLAWDLGVICVGLMAYVNIIAILLLSKTGLKVWKDYKVKRKAGIEDSDFNPKEIGIKNADFWEK